jgi:hypothetical protein
MRPALEPEGAVRALAPQSKKRNHLTVGTERERLEDGSWGRHVVEADVQLHCADGVGGVQAVRWEGRCARPVVEEVD